MSSTKRMGRQNSKSSVEYLRIGKKIIKFNESDKIAFTSIVHSITQTRISSIKSRLKMLPRTTKKQWILSGFIRLNDLSQSDKGAVVIDFLIQTTTFNYESNPTQHFFRARSSRIKVRRGKYRKRISLVVRRGSRNRS